MYMPTCTEQLPQATTPLLPSSFPAEIQVTSPKHDCHAATDYARLLLLPSPQPCCSIMLRQASSFSGPQTLEAGSARHDSASAFGGSSIVHRTLTPPPQASETLASGGNCRTLGVFPRTQGSSANDKVAAIDERFCRVCLPVLKLFI
jgi:hypothetical protein